MTQKKSGLKTKLLVTALLQAVSWIGCSNGPSEAGGRPTDGSVGSACGAADDCFPDVADDLVGERQCLDRIEGGYCTHECESDADCCAVEGECPNDIDQVCSPFESEGRKLCFLSCEKEAIEALEPSERPEDENEFCRRFAGAAFTCRSSGGGSENRKICVPEECGGLGSHCDSKDDCDGGLTCDTDLAGGTCTIRGCSANDDCPGKTVCVRSGDESHCARPCDDDTDCSACGEGADDLSSRRCESDVELFDGTKADVCR